MGLWKIANADVRLLGEYYGNNFSNLIHSLRNDLDKKELPIIYGDINLPITNFPAVDYVKKAQDSVNIYINNTFLIKTNNIEKASDKVHFSSKGYLILGEEFGNKLIQVIENQYPK